MGVNFGKHRIEARSGLLIRFFLPRHHMQKVIGVQIYFWVKFWFNVDAILGENGVDLDKGQGQFWRTVGMVLGVV